MACCSSSIRLSLHKSRHLRCSKRKQRLVVANALNSGDEPQSGVGVTVVTKEGDVGSIGKDFGALGANYTHTDSGSGGVDVLDDGNNGNGNFLGGGGSGGGGGGGGGGGDGDEGGDEEEQEFGPIMKFEEVMKETKARGASLPMDMLEAAKSVGIRKVLLLRYLDLQGSTWPLGFAMKSCSMLRNRMLADPSFLFKVGTEIVIDSCCATLAEVQKRGKDFWAEFELYLADLLVGVVVNVALVGMLAPYARIGQPSLSKGAFGRMQNAYAALPSSVFEAERPGCRFSVKQRNRYLFFQGCYVCISWVCLWPHRSRHCKFDNDCQAEHKEIRRGHTCSTSFEECSSLGCFPSSFFQHPLSDHQRIGAVGRIISFGKAGSTRCDGFYGWRAIRQQYLRWDAVCGLGQIERVQ
ncbi:reticulata-like protein, putative [Actinidia rufa]|uniref:Reticulata-like protein, putative n=1 Tax=Actinidia rufa TaxID=165716 RepID=A0A7J0F4S3_9ERIC|nr:reticulata-like protein, putative [Actinidia rufa]